MKLFRILIFALLFIVILIAIFALYKTSFSKEEVIEVVEEPKETVFQPEKLYWKKITETAPWGPRDSSETFLFNDKMWLIGGINGNAKVGEDHSVEYWKAPHFNDIWNTEDGVTWTQVAKTSAWAPRRSMSVAFFNDKLWMFGGWSPITGYTNDIWVSEDGIQWKKVIEHADWPAREGQLTEVFNGKLYLIGGVNYDRRETKNDVWVTEDGIHWAEVKDIPWSGRWDHATAVFNDKIYLTGGMNLNQESFNDVWVTEDGKQWKLVTASAPWVTRQGHVMEVYEDRLWIIGRLNDKESGYGPNDVWFSEDGISWTKTDQDPLWTGREDFFSEVFKDKMWIFGGMDSEWKWRADVWVSVFEL